MPHLKLIEQGTNQPFIIDIPDAIIGRDPASTIYLEGVAAKAVSARHARLSFTDGQWFAEDAGSSNGTFVGGLRLETGFRHALKVGDILRFGATGPQLEVREVQMRTVAATMIEQPPVIEPPRAPSVTPPTAPARPPAAGTMPLRRGDLLRDEAHAATGPAATAPARAASPSPDPATDGGSAAHVRVVLRGVQSGTRFTGRGEKVTIGRGLECTVHLEGEAATAVSRVHAELAVESGKVVLRDGKSRNGTLLNGKPVVTPQPVRKGDLIALGPGGPAFTVEEAVAIDAEDPSSSPNTSTPAMTTAAPSTPAPPPAQKPPGPATRMARATGAGRTALFRNVLEEVTQKNAKRVRVVAWSTVGVGLVMTAGVVVFARMQVDRTDQALERERVGFRQQAAQMSAQLDSVRTSAATDRARARSALDSAMRVSAPAAVLDSLRGALAGADRRTVALQESLTRARVSLDQQLAAGDVVRHAAEQELSRLKSQIAGAQATGLDSRAVLDSLHRALARAEDRAKTVGEQIRAVKGVDLAQVSQLNQAAVGLVTTYSGKDAYNGSGFVISSSGYFVTNRHVARPDTLAAADSIFVTMADQKYSLRTELVMVADKSGPDFAVLKILNYKGPHIAKIDWTSAHAVQGEPAALIGFPAGADNAFDAESVVRSSMSAGIFSKVTPELIQFDGFTVGGSSGSPIFNAAGEVVALHRAGLRQGTGLGFAVPLSRVAPLLRPDLRAELGIR